LAAFLITIGSSASSAAPVDDLVAAIADFRGLGTADVSSYRVELRLPDDGEDVATLVETWASPARLSVRAASPGTPVAVVRGLALFLEPLFVTRTSIFSADLEGSVERLRADLDVTEAPLAEEGTRKITVVLPDPPPDDLPELLRDLARLEGTLDGEGRLAALSVQLRSERETEEMTMRCEWAEGEPQPRRAVWTLPNSDRVEIETTYRSEGGRVVPAMRRVTFPSRYDPGETEEIRVVYGRYDLDPLIEEGEWTAHGTFRYDANGLVDD
jgi:hypothetical protein